MNIDQLFMSELLKPVLTSTPRSYSKYSIDRLSSKFRFFNPSEHEVFGDTTTHIRYNCPYCFEERGKDDDDGKFYWDKTKLVGYCFKCHTSGILKMDRNIEEVRLDNAIRHIESMTEKTSSNLTNSLPTIDYYKMFDELDTKSIDFLNSRLPFYSYIAPSFHMMTAKDIGIVVPIYYFGKVVSYNLRYFHPTSHMKYYIPEGVKYLYSPNNVFQDKYIGSEVTLVEGLFDTVA